MLSACSSDPKIKNVTRWLFFEMRRVRCSSGESGVISENSISEDEEPQRKKRLKGVRVSSTLLDVSRSALSGVLPIVMSLPEAKTLGDDQRDVVLSTLDFFSNQILDILANDALVPSHGNKISLDLPILKR